MISSLFGFAKFSYNIYVGKEQVEIIQLIMAKVHVAAPVSGSEHVSKYQVSLRDINRNLTGFLSNDTKAYLKA